MIFSVPGNVEALVGIANADGALGVVPHTSSTPRLSIVVLPFANIGGDPEQDYFAAVMTDDRSARLAAAEATLIKALSIAPQHARAQAILGILQISTNRAAQGIAKCEHALVLDRNFATAHAFIGHAKYQLGRAAETEAHVNEALRLSPRDTSTSTEAVITTFNRHGSLLLLRMGLTKLGPARK